MPLQIDGYTPTTDWSTMLNYGLSGNQGAGGTFGAPAGYQAPMATAGGGGGSMWDSFLTQNGQQGWGNMALGTAQGLFNAWMGMQQYGLAKDQLRQSKKEFGLNYEAQRNLTNSQLEDRQRARVASNPTGYQSVGDYMNQYGIKPAGG